jgi:hypothetical protein
LRPAAGNGALKEGEATMTLLLTLNDFIKFLLFTIETKDVQFFT